MSAADQPAPVAPALYTVVRCNGGPAVWLQRLLGPVVAAARFERAPPLELRPTGHWSGFCAALDYSPDGRVSVSGRATLRPQSALVEIYLHEAAHRLAWPRADEGAHNAKFFALNYALLKRCDELRLSPTQVSLSMSLYDLQDLPAELWETEDRGLGRALTWAVTVGKEMAGSSLSAEGMATEIVRRYDAWLVELGQEPARAARQRTAALADEGSIHRLRGQVKFRGLVIGWLSLTFASTILLVLLARVSG